MNCNGSNSSTSSYVVIKIFSLLVTPLLNAPLVLIMVSVVIKSSNHRPISQSLIYWDLISTFVSLVLLSTAMLVAVGGLKGSSWSAPRRGEKNWRASLSGLKITQNKTSSKPPCSTTPFTMLRTSSEDKRWLRVQLIVYIFDVYSRYLAWNRSTWS